MDTAVDVDALTVRRGRATVFSGLDLRVAAGAVTGVLGPSGCGKTTLLRSIVGVQKVAAGTVTVLDRPAGDRWLRGRVAYATQGSAVYQDLSVRQNLRYFAAVLGLRGAAARDAVERTVQRVGLGEQADRLVSGLSGGQAGRVSLAVALLGDPRLLVLDEPTVGLDPVLRAELWELFRSLADAGVTLIVSSHVMDEALRCDRLLLLRQGQLIADTTPDGLLSSTGTRDPEAAFLALVRAEPGAA